MGEEKRFNDFIQMLELEVRGDIKGASKEEEKTVWFLQVQPQKAHDF